MQIHRPPGGQPVALQLWNAAQSMGELFDKHLAEAGGSRYHFFVFVALERLPQPSQRELAEAVGVDDATITHHLAAMERAGLVDRVRDPADRRIQRVSLTPDGEAMWAAMNEAVDRYNESQLAGLSLDELELLSGLLNRIDTNSRRLLDAAAVTVAGDSA